MPESTAHLPCAWGTPPGSGRIRVAPEDFIVREWLGFPADGEGDHFLLTVRKRGANTHWVAKQLARLGMLHPVDVGFAGLKDRDAVTEQSFTVPVRSAIGENWPGVTGEGFEVTAAARHRRKLKRGALRGNDFEIVVRDWHGDDAALRARLEAIGLHGVPNYFGPQRFGRDGNNLRVAERWFGQGDAPQDRLQRSFALSAARAAIFNAVLAERVNSGTWNRLLEGEIANLDGSGSVFAVNAVDEALAERCRILDIHPSGPMFGKSAKVPQGAAGAAERDIVGRFAVLTAGLTAAGIEGERRALRMRVGKLEWDLRDRDLRLRFRLPKGTFATAVLHELIADAFAQPTPEGAED